MLSAPSASGSGAARPGIRDAPPRLRDEDREKLASLLEQMEQAEEARETRLAWLAGFVRRPSLISVGLSVARRPQWQTGAG